MKNGHEPKWFEPTWLDQNGHAREVTKVLSFACMLQIHSSQTRKPPALSRPTCPSPLTDPPAPPVSRDFVPPSSNPRHKRRMPIPPKRENPMRLCYTVYRCQTPVPAKRENMHLSTHRCRMPIPPKREHKPPSTMLIAQRANPFPSWRHCATHVASCRAQAQPAGLLVDSVSDLTHNQHRPVLQWDPSPARKNPTQILPAACGRFHAVTLQEAGDHVPHVSDQFNTYTDGNDLAILLNKDTFEPGAAVCPISEASLSKDTWGMVALFERGLLRRPSVADSSHNPVLLSPHSQQSCQ